MLVLDHVFNDMAFTECEWNGPIPLKATIKNGKFRSKFSFNQSVSHVLFFVCSPSICIHNFVQLNFFFFRSTFFFLLSFVAAAIAVVVIVCRSLRCKTFL